MSCLMEAHRGLTVGLLLLRYSVVCTVESLSLSYISFRCVLSLSHMVSRVGVVLDCIGS